MEPRKAPERIPEKPRRGLVLVITGDGKGKTTSCLGMAVRAIGYGMKVLMVQFIKGSLHYGELDESVGFLIGTPTLNSNLPHPILSLIGHLVVLNLRGKTASAFGSYGWSGEAIKMVQDILTAMRIKVSPEPIKFKMTPSAQDLDTCFEFGKKFAEGVGGKSA